MQLRDYQKKIIYNGIKILKKFNILYLALEVRTGKTIIALQIAHNFGAKNILFVTKKKAIASINNDCKKINITATVINYESIHKLNDFFDFIIVDEAHSLGAYPKPSKRTKELKKICRNYPIIYLSGTPTPESYSQLYHQFWISFYSPFKEYRNFYKWSKDFVNVKKKYLYNREINDYSDAIIDKIKPIIKPLIITFTQKEAGFNQVIKEKVLTVKMQDSTYSLAKKLQKDLIYQGNNGSVILADTAVKLQSKLHQIYSGSIKDEDGKSIFFDTTKAEFIKDYFKDQKIAIYYKFIGECNILKKIFDNWTDNPEDFQQNNNLIFIGQFLSAREGIRLDTADAIIFYNIDFAYLSYEQAKNRIMSKERMKQAYLYWIFSEGGIEQKIYKMVTQKKNYTNYYFKKDYGIRK